MAEQAPSSPKVARRWPRFTIRGLLWTTTAIAALFPAAWFAWFLLLNASTSWSAHAMLGTGLLLAVAAAVAMSGSGSLRAFWSGVATVGFAYYVIVVCDVTAIGTQSYRFDREKLVTSQVNLWVHREYMYPIMIAKFGNSPFPSGPDAPLQEDFDQVAHLLWTFFFAAGGGLISLILWAVLRPRATLGGDDERS